MYKNNKIVGKNQLHEKRCLQTNKSFVKLENLYSMYRDSNCNVTLGEATVLVVTSVGQVT